MTATPREFDIVLYGATGFVGKLTAEYLARAGEMPGSRWPVKPVTATPREFDIVLYGATGFVGKLTAEYLARASPIAAPP